MAYTGAGASIAGWARQARAGGWGYAGAGRSGPLELSRGRAHTLRMGFSDSNKNHLGALAALLTDTAPTNYLAPTQETFFNSLINTAPPAPANALFGNLGLINTAPAPSAETLVGILGLINGAPAPSVNALFGNTGFPNSLSQGLSSAPASPGWRHVIARFTKFMSNVAVTSKQNADGQTQQAGVISCLNRHFWNHGSETLNATLIGSWGKDTRTQPPRDADILFLLPDDIYWQYQDRTGNRQSQLLQDVKLALAGRYPRTDLRGDGQVVLVPFSPPIEVVPAFRCTDGSIIICDTNNGGRYSASTAAAELADLNHWDAYYGGHVRALIRMMKTWQHEKSVDIKSFHIERLAIEFLRAWPNSFRGVFFYDWMIRDFLAFLIGRANGWIYMPGTGEAVFLGDAWLSRAQTAHKKAIQACNYERDNYEALAGAEWREIFGSAIPILAS